jgi:hypothetical protein
MGLILAALIHHFQVVSPSAKFRNQFRQPRRCRSKAIEAGPSSSKRAWRLRRFLRLMGRVPFNYFSFGDHLGC